MVGKDSGSDVDWHRIAHCCGSDALWVNGRSNGDSNGWQYAAIRVSIRVKHVLNGNLVLLYCIHPIYGTVLFG
jgi:hypothetical protein